MPSMANKNLDKCVLLLRQMMDRDSGSVSSSGGRKLGLKKKSKRVSVLPTATRPKVKKKDGKVVTTRKVFSKTKLNLDAVKKPLSKLTSAPIAMAQDTHEVEQLSQKPEREFQHGKTSQLPEHTSDRTLHSKSAIHFDKPFTALQLPRQCSQPVDRSTASCLNQPANQSDAMQQSGAAPPFNQRLLSSTPQLTPVKVAGPPSDEVTNADPLPLNSSDQIRAVRPASPSPIIPRLLEGVVTFQPQPGVTVTPGMTPLSRVDPLPPFIGVTSQHARGSNVQQFYDATGYDQQTGVAEFNLPNAAWLDDYPVKDGTSGAGYAPAVHGQPYTQSQTQFYPNPASHGQMEQHPHSLGQHPHPGGQHPPPVGQNLTLQNQPGILFTSGVPAHPGAYLLPSTQPETRSHPGVTSGVNYTPSVLSHLHDEQAPSSAAGDFCTSILCPQDSKDVTFSPPVKEKSATSTPVKGNFELYSDCGTATASPVTHNPRSTSRASSCVNSKRPPVGSRASESQKLASLRMSAGVSARTTKSLDRDPKSASRERKKRTKAKPKTSDELPHSVDAEVQVGTPGGMHSCDCETETDSSDHVTQDKVDEDMEKKCSAAKNHLRTLTYLLKELKTLSGMAGHSAPGQGEIGRLVSEMEQTVSLLLPRVMTLSWQTEIDLAMLPLRSENAQLRRRVRILTQQLKEKTREVEEAQKPDPTFEVVQLQVTEHQLKKDLSEEKMEREKLRQEFTLLEQDFRQVTTQKQELLQVLANKERAHQKSMEESQQELRDMKAAQEASLKDQEKHTLQVEEATNKVASLEVTLKERDRELSHMHSLVKSLQSNMTSLLSDFHGPRLHMSDFVRARPQPGVQKQDNISEANGLHRQEWKDSLPADTCDRDGLADSACYSRGSDSLTPSTRSRRELNFNALQASPNGATANWAATIQQGNSPCHQQRQDDAHKLSPPKRDALGSTPSRPLRTEDLNQLCGFSPPEGDTSVATDYMVPPGVSPMQKLQQRGSHPVQDHAEAPSNAPTVKQMLVALAGKIQQQQKQDDHMTAVANHSSSTLYDAGQGEEDAESTLEDNQVEEEVVWKELPRDRTVDYNETRYSVTDYFSKYRQCSRFSAGEPGQNKAGSQRPLQQDVYRDTDLDTTISSIQDMTQLIDQSCVSSLTSSVSSLASSVSVDDQVFREGLNSLDATIAQIQKTIRQAMHRGQVLGDNQLTYVKR